MTYPFGTIFRIPGHQRIAFRAICFEERIVPMMDRSPSDLSYSTLEDWVASLPHTLSEVMIDSTLAHACEEQAKKPMEITATPAKWKVPRITRELECLKWPRHIYHLLKECNLLSRQDICEAYHSFIEVLMEHRHEIRTVEPLLKYKYQHGIEFNWDMHAPEGSIRESVRLLDRGLTRESARILLNQIQAAYLPLYNRIKDVVVPYMKNKIQEERRAKDIARYQKLLTKTVRAHQALLELHARQEAGLRATMQQYRAHLDALEHPVE